MKIGIFLAYAPGINLSNQGLGRQLVQFARGFHQHSGEAMAILCPSWLTDDLEEILSQADLPDSAYSIVCPPGGIPVSFRIQRFLSALLKSLRAKRPSLSIWRKLQGISFVYVPFRKAMVYLLSTRSITGFVLTSVALLATAVAVAPIALPLIVVAGLVYAVARLWRRARRDANALAAKFPALNRLYAFLLNVREANQISLLQRAYNQIYRRETSWMVEFANNDKTVDFWFSPTVFWPEFNAIRKPSALCFPDMVLSEFPVAFAVDHPYSRSVFSRSQKAIEGGKHFITYSDVTAEDGLQRRFGVDRRRISVIPHGAIDLSHHISIAGTLDPDQARRRFAVDLLEGHRNVHWQDHPYLANFSFENTNYFFYPAQVRPNKNLVNLIRGYELSLRRKHQYAKLILTGDLAASAELSSFIKSRRLQYEILYFHNVPEQVLAALYHLAQLVVNPTLYEGGFPFTFAEGLSVGTPSIMSDIPQVRQSIPDSLAQEILFDPYSPEAIADSMAYGLSHRARLLDLQIPIYQQMRERSWSDVASDHIAVFSQICAEASLEGGRGMNGPRQATPGSARPTG